jgi:hypothetical protein
LVGKSKMKRPLGRVGVEERIRWKQILKICGTVWTEFIWPEF